MGLRPVHHFAVGLAVGYAAARVFARRRPRASHKQVHTVLTHAKFESAEHKEAWKALWKTLAEMVYRDEPRCLSYELCDSTDDPAHWIGALVREAEWLRLHSRHSCGWMMVSNDLLRDIGERERRREEKTGTC